MSRWFRVYEGLIDDPKWIRLGPDLRSAVITVWCIAARNNGRSPSLEDLSFHFRLSEARTQKLVDELTRCGYIDKDEEGMAPHNWSGRQHIDEGSGGRVKRHRAKRLAAGLLSQWQPSPELRHKVYASDRYACVYCGAEDDLTIDHKTPELRGGGHNIENLQTLCRSCNASKRDKTHEEHIACNDPVTVTVTPLEQNRAESEPETEQIKTESKKEDAAIAAPIDARTTLFRDGLARLERLTGKPPPQCRALLGRWLRDCQDDCVALTRVLEDAEVNRVADPVAWITRALKPKTAAGRRDEIREQWRGARDKLDQFIDAAASSDVRETVVRFLPGARPGKP